MKKIVVLTGAGISAESGISTFRDSDGLWEQYRVEDVATPEGYAKDKALVLDFYNQRRRQLATVKPNEGHRQLVRLEEFYDVQIVTQNVDNLHEQAGSKNVLHGDKAPDGTQLRPHIVWFGEAVPNIEPAAQLCEVCDYFIVVGTSMNVYPAAGLIHYVPRTSPCYLVDPKAVTVSRNITVIQEKAGTGVKKVVDELIELAKK